ncbi:hypothetical protein GWI33_013561 [Rhynchophorus ferrugineus]|uniref:Uncharacterized protein n=1 Tax=Rhynchophorus ferrugineus TaxID=354439 RepID=A0A834I6V6_RHYFE|nr:hypothetical protein GWI33_013561 [Rhynchophorus ferrugineus]
MKLGFNLIHVERWKTKGENRLPSSKWSYREKSAVSSRSTVSYIKWCKYKPNAARTGASNASTARSSVTHRKIAKLPWPAQVSMTQAHVLKTKMPAKMRQLWPTTHCQLLEMQMPTNP